MRKAEHPVIVRAMPGKQAGAAGRTRRRGIECMTEQNPHAGKLLQVRRWNVESVWLNVPPGIVRMDVEDIGVVGCSRLTAVSEQSRARHPLNPIAPGITQNQAIRKSASRLAELRAE